MRCNGQTLFMGCLLLISPLLVKADSDLLMPPTDRCSLNTAPEDLPKALENCQQTAESGNAQAQYELGDFYYEDPRTERDLNKARHWFEQASLQGNAPAQLRLGTMFFRGEGVPANNVQAYIILKMAAVNGSDEAMDSADLVAEKMDRNEMEMASQVLGQIFRDYLMTLQNIGRSPFGE
ncbi:tetratricopeptide repeat protein [Pseudomonas sp. LRF_L74]|uniref:tetratricopeptide repeat protein n=1 Tax=Pseudomonas sp. LRF_L74 TaxID=3369422 RepID=UPI003F5FC457